LPFINNTDVLNVWSKEFFNELGSRIDVEEKTF